ncbi:MAG: hypothetical protein EXR47_03520 [Dehalococcoidia bacterium]|nr:hypothetical protein [Dehalococcoidia bacterium]
MTAVKGPRTKKQPEQPREPGAVVPVPVETPPAGKPAARPKAKEVRTVYAGLYEPVDMEM